MLGVKCVIAQSYERIHRSNLVGMGILPLQFDDPNILDLLNGEEEFQIDLPEKLSINDQISVTTNTNVKFTCKSRLDTAPEIEYYRNQGILNYVMRKILN